jgi:endonuclease/exonuclease/phosphatase family metal-dependent hydrolase
MELDLLTVNLWGLPWPFARERLARKRRFREHLAGAPYDVVGIQELWWPWRRTLELGSLVLPEGRRDSGLALAGRLAPRDVRVEHFDEGAGPDRLKRKGALRASVETPAGDTLSLWVVHLQAGRGHAAIRARQVRQLLEPLADERRPLVLMGDFNFYEGSAEDRDSAERLAAAGLADAALALACADPTYHAASNRYLRRRRRLAHRFDRVYLRGGGGVQVEPLAAEVLRLAPDPVSDHHPLRVRVRLSRAARA